MGAGYRSRYAQWTGTLNELSPKGEFAGNENPFGIIKTLAARRKIPIVDNRKPRR